MLERAKEVTGSDGYRHIEYARWADDLVILVDGHRKWDWLARAVYQRLCEELVKLDVTINQEKTRQVDLVKGESFSFLGFDFRRSRTLKGAWGGYENPEDVCTNKTSEEYQRGVQATWITTN